MNRFIRRYMVVLAAFSTPLFALAATNCDILAKPSAGCAAGYSLTCVSMPDGTDGWDCAVDPAASGAGTQPVSAGTVSPTVAPAEPVAAASVQPVSPIYDATPQPTSALYQQADSVAVPAPGTVGGAADALGEAEGTLEDAVKLAPAPLVPIIEAVLATLGAVIFLLGMFEWLKRLKERRDGRCGRCGSEKSEPITCGACEGEGKIEKEIETEIGCPHCDVSGEDPCHGCSGNGGSCERCGGSGKTVDKETGKPAECCVCKGEKVQEIELSHAFTCPFCKGAGKS